MLHSILYHIPPNGVLIKLSLILVRVLEEGKRKKKQKRNNCPKHHQHNIN